MLVGKLLKRSIRFTCVRWEKITETEYEIGNMYNDTEYTTENEMKKRNITYSEQFIY